MGNQCVIAVTGEISKVTAGAWDYPQGRIHSFSTLSTAYSIEALQQPLIAITIIDCLSIRIPVICRPLALNS